MPSLDLAPGPTPSDGCGVDADPAPLITPTKGSRVPRDLIATATASTGESVTVTVPGEIPLERLAITGAVALTRAVTMLEVPDAGRTSAPAAEDHDVMTVPELAELLRVRPHTIYAAIRAGEIPGAKRVGRLLRIDRASVDRWMQTQDKRGAPRR